MKADKALNQLTKSMGLKEEEIKEIFGEDLEKFFKILGNDAKKSLTAVRLVLSCKTITSQLIDNLNASIHLRALLTDLFVVDEYIKIVSKDI